MDEPKGYWSKVFSEAVRLMRERPKIGGETAFWMARSIVDKSLDTLPFAEKKNSN